MAIRNIAVINVLKSDYFRIEISPVLPASRYHGLLKSDYFRIEIILKWSKPSLRY